MRHACSVIGSSPCVWGQDKAEVSKLNEARIIPMRVGTRLLVSQMVSLIRDHPHACGDKICKASATTSTSGSSPCVWGQVVGTIWEKYGLGIIPMRVGTSRLQRCKNKLKRDHPHACGDKYLLVTFTSAILGSSPCVWGQVSSLGFPIACCRIIPMRVGTSNCPCREYLRHQDHPHACGDKNSAKRCIIPSGGSSPCVWGQVLFGQKLHALFRIIPMRVGTS